MRFRAPHCAVAAFGREMVAPVPPLGLGAGGMDVFVGAAVGGDGDGVFVAATVAVNVGVAERTIRTGVHVGMATLKLRTLSKDAVAGYRRVRRRRRGADRAGADSLRR